MERPALCADRLSIRILHCERRIGTGRNVLCAEKQSLLLEYHSFVQEYAAATADLAKLRPTASAANYRGLLKHAEDTRHKSESAREALERHTRQHGC